MVEREEMGTSRKINAQRYQDETCGYSTLKLPKLKCLRCDHEWIPRSEKLPEVCPNCNSPYWNNPRKHEKEAV